MNTSRILVSALALSFASTFFGAAATMASDDPNIFNRIFVPPKDRIASLRDDGIHDPDSPALQILQEPNEAFRPLDTSDSGNYVNWVKAVESGKIAPRFDYLDAAKQATPIDLYIVMEVKGSMPNVAFPHQTHTQILDCDNCHTDIFVPQKGANPMSMAQIMLGQKCGVCHGSVAFPVTECRRCHSEAKRDGQAAGATGTR
jgi:c(7)-type cytochrome triheme protein